MADILVTGGTGFIGTALVRQLAASGHRVICTVRPERTDLSRLQNLADVVLVHTPLDDPQQLSAALHGVRPSLVYNLAASGVGLAERGALALVAGNVNVVASLMQVAADWPLQRFIHVGSCSEYGMVAAQPVSEDTPLLPCSPYGGAKAAASTLALGLAPHLGIPLVVLRLFGVFGIGEAHFRLLPSLLSALRQDLPCALTSGTQVRDFTWIDDMVAALLVAGQIPLPLNSVFNVGTGQGHTVREIAEKMADLLGAPRHLLHFGARPQRNDEPQLLVSDPRRFQKATGWSAQTTMDTALQKMLAVGEMT